MTDPTPTPIPAGFVSPFQQILDEGTMKVPQGPDLYDQLMGPIEPELTSQELPGLTAKYAQETQAQSAARAERYEKAFEAYQKQLNVFLEGMNRNAQHYQRTAMATTEKQDRTAEQAGLQDLSSQISTA
jgi:hypothetical protein